MDCLPGTYSETNPKKYESTTVSMLFDSFPDAVGSKIVGVGIHNEAPCRQLLVTNDRRGQKGFRLL